MGSYLPSTAGQKRKMLEAVGVSQIEALYDNVPASIRLDGLDLAPGRSEMEVSAQMRALADKNHVFHTIFRGAGAYDHYIPAIVERVCNKEEFLTAYTPYQAEISQGILQSIFEYQTMLCELTGMDASNASVYDGASAAAEAVAMCRDRKRKRALVSAAAHPAVIQTIQTYCAGADAEVALIPTKDGRTDLDALRAMLCDTDACVYLQQPNFYGNLEDAEATGAAAHEAGAKFILGIHPIAAAILKSPRECGADIAVGEGQPLGMPLAFGGPYLGFMACTQALCPQAAGPHCGRNRGRSGRTLLCAHAPGQGTAHPPGKGLLQHLLQPGPLCHDARPSTWRRWGPRGCKKQRSSAMQRRTTSRKSWKRSASRAAIPARFSRNLSQKRLSRRSKFSPSWKRMTSWEATAVEGGILWCATEKNTKAQIDALIGLLKEVCA